MDAHRGILLFAAGFLIPVSVSFAKAELRLRPCNIELLDGRVVEGMLAVQFDMLEHLIIYSPQLAMVRSFLAEHVHALTVGGEREELNPKRALTDRERERLGETEWPDAPPKRGHKPAYTIETWEAPKRLMVWATPGKRGRFEEARNWLVNGRKAEALTPYEYVSRTPPTFRHTKYRPIVGPHVDVLIPAAKKRYAVWLMEQTLGSARPRHITVGANGELKFALTGAYGNIWISQSAYYAGLCEHEEM